MENELDLDNLTKEDFMAMAEYVAHTEAINNKLLELHINSVRSKNSKYNRCFGNTISTNQY